MTNTSENTESSRLAFTIHELGQAVGGKEKPLSPSHIYREIQAGHLEVTKIGKRTVVTVEQAKAWLERRARTAPLQEPKHLVRARAKKQACRT